MESKTQLDVLSLIHFRYTKIPQIMCIQETHDSMQLSEVGILGKTLGIQATK